MKELGNTLEYWVNEASKGRNIAECWQAINKIITQQKIKCIDEKIEMMDEAMDEAYKNELDPEKVFDYLEEKKTELLEQKSLLQ